MTTFRIPLLVTAALATAALAACGPADDTASSDSSLTINPDTSMGLDASPSPSATASQGTTHGGGSTGNGGGSNTGGGSQDYGPRIVSFTISKQPSCPAGTNVAPIEGLPVEVSWKVTGTDKVTISVDGPGVYDTFPAEGTKSFQFGCEGSPGSTQKHTYLLKTVGGGEVKQKTLTATATVNEVAIVATQAPANAPQSNTSADATQVNADDLGTPVVRNS
ncbi:MAG TPA: hypothetical protein VI011_12750 [Asanoa sp.]